MRKYDNYYQIIACFGGYKNLPCVIKSNRWQIHPQLMPAILNYCFFKHLYSYLEICKCSSSKKKGGNKLIN